MSRFLVAAIQLNSQPDLAHNIAQCHKMVEQAAQKGARFVGLPENFAFLGDEKEKHKRAPQIRDEVLASLPRWSREFGIYILAGGFPAPDESELSHSKAFNRALLFTPDGGILAKYDKIHMFDISLSEEENYRESELVAAGASEAVVAVIPPESLGIPPETHGVRFGLSICYDIRFPELYRRLAEKQADVLCIPSAFTQPTGKAHWEVLLRARAIENSCYVIAPAQTGLHGISRKTYGHSMIIDPWGQVLADAATDPGVITAEIDTAKLDDIRKKLPSLTHRVM